MSQDEGSVLSPRLDEVGEMKAYKLAGTINRHRQLVVDLPREVHEGPIEVILLAPEPERAQGSIRDHVSDLMARTSGRSVVEIDERIRRERESWD